MKFKTAIQHLIADSTQLVKWLFILLIVFMIIRSCINVSKLSLPYDVHEMINNRYSSCATVRGVQGPLFREGDNPQRECSSVDSYVVGQGTIPKKEINNGVVKAICFRVLVEQPYFLAQSQTQYEEITFSSRIASKVALLQNDEWIIYPDQYLEDSERWSAYECPGEFEITEDDWIKEK